MMRRTIPFILVLALFRCSVGFAGDGDGWAELWANKTAEADKLFAAAGEKATAPEKLAAQEGRLACARADGDYKRVWDISVEQARTAAKLDNGLEVFFYRRLLQLPNYYRRPELIALGEELLAAGGSPALREEVSEYLYDAYRSRRQYAQADKLRAGRGYVDLFASVVGPLRDYAGFQLDNTLDPEFKPGLDSYSGPDGKQALVLHDIETDRGDTLSLYDEIPWGRRDAAAYSTALLDCAAAGEYLLAVCCAGDCKIWLNGNPAFRSDAYEFAYRKRERTVKVRLAQGVNALVLKSSAGATFKLRLLGLDGAAAGGVSSRKYDQASVAKYPCRQLKGFVAGSPARAPFLSLLEGEKNPVQAWRLWLADAYGMEAEIESEHAVWEELVAANPASIFILSSAARRLRDEAGQGVDGRERLIKQMLELVEKLKAVAPDNLNALALAAENYAENDQDDQAIELYKKTAAAFPNAVPERLQLAQLYEKKGWNALAETEYAALAGLEPGLLARQAMFLAKSGKDAEAQTIYLKLWEQGELNEFSWRSRLMTLGKWSEARKLLDEWYAQNPRDKRSYSRMLLDWAHDSGDAKLREKLLQERLQDDPVSPRPAVDMGEFYLVLGNTADATKWFAEADRRATEDEQIDLELRRRILKLGGSDWALESYDVPLSDMNHTAVLKKDHPRASHALLLRVVVRRIYEDRSCESLIHNAIKLFDKAGISSLSELSVPQGSDDLLFCRTVQPDGRVYVPTSVENLQLGKATSMYNVRENSVLEYAYRQTDRGGRAADWNDYFQTEFDNVPAIRSRYVLILPEKLEGELSLRVTPDELLPVRSVKNGLVTYQWDVGEKKGIEPEFYLPADEEEHSGLRLALHGDGYVGGSHEFQRPEPIRSDKAVRDKAVAIVGTEKDPERQAALLFSWITREIKDMDGAKTARDCLAMGGGDDAARAELFRAMLEALGVNSCYAEADRGFSRAGNGGRGPRASGAGGFGWPRLVLAELPGGDSLWVNFQSPARHFRLDDLGGGLTGELALQTDDSGLRLVRVRSGEDEADPDTKFAVSLFPDGAAEVDGDIVFRGTLAARLRAVAEQPQQGPLAMERMAARFFPKMTVTDKNYPQPNSADAGTGALPEREPFPYRFKGKIAGFCRTEGEELSFSPFAGQLGTKSFITPLPRKREFEISRDAVLSQSLTYLAPEGWAFSKVPADRWWKTDYGVYVMDFNVEGNRLSASRFLILPTQKLKVEEYAALHAWLTEVEKTERLSVSLAKLPADVAFSPTFESGPAEMLKSRPFCPRFVPKGIRREEQGD